MSCPPTLPTCAGVAHPCHQPSVATSSICPTACAPMTSSRWRACWRFFAGVYRCSPAHLAGVVTSVGLAPALTKRVQALSKGYSRRLMLAIGLLTAAAPPHGRVL